MPGVSANSGAMSSKGKRKRKQKGVPGVTALPPEVNEDDLYVSDEDLQFVKKHAQYAGFMASLDTATINKAFEGPKKPKQPAKKIERPVDDIESRYEERAERNAAKDDDNEENNMAVEYLDALPVKSLTGELRYLTKPKKPDTKLEERKANLQKANGTFTESTSEVHEEVPTVETVPEEEKEKKVKLTKQERKKLKKEEKKKAIEEKKASEEATSNGRVDQDADKEKEEVSYISVQQRRMELKAHMAELGMGLLANPETNLGSLKELQEMCEDRDDPVARLALLSSMAVFKDILPGYRIRLPTAKELEMVVSKEVRQLRDFETALLKYYQKYVQTLIRSAKSPARRLTALKCMCGLLEAAPHFNYRDSMLKSMVPRMMSFDDEISKLACDAVKSLLRNEAKHGGEATVEAVQLIAELVKSRRYRVRPAVVEVFLELSFDENIEKSSTTEKMAEKANVKKSKRVEKKEKKEKKKELARQLRKEVKDDFKEASSAPDVILRKKLQTQTLAAMFETYFGVLKASLEPPDEKVLAAVSREIDEGFDSLGLRPLLGPSLDGLGKFSYLINVDFMADLLSTLGVAAAGGNNADSRPPEDLLTVGERLQCCMVAFKIVRSNLDALTIDLRDFYVQLYNLLFEFNSVRHNIKYSKVFAEALQVMLWDNRQHDMQRAAGFLKRLSTLALHLAPAEAMAALVTVRYLLQRYKKCRNLLENDGGGGAVGGNLAKYTADGDDPDVSGALSSVLWDVTLLRRHAHPGVVKIASEIASMTVMTESSMLLSLSPSDAIDLYSTREGGFRPAVQSPPKLVKRKAFKSAGPMSVTSFDDLAMPGGRMELEEAEISVVPESETVEIGKNLGKEFRALRNFRENEMLRKQLRKVTARLELHKSYLASKPSRKSSKVNKALKPIPIISKKRKP